VLYSQPGLFFCGKVKEFLSRKRIVYVERDISRDEQALEESFAQIRGGGFVPTAIASAPMEFRVRVLF